MMRTLLVVGGLAGLMAFSGCGASHSDFPIVVANRNGNPISVLVDGNGFADVGVGQVASLSIEVQDSGYVKRDFSGNFTSPSPVSRVTFSARDLATGALSVGKEATLSKFAAAYVEFGPGDF